MEAATTKFTIGKTFTNYPERVHWIDEEGYIYDIDDFTSLAVRVFEWMI